MRDPYKLALLLLTIAVIPLLYISIWLGLAAVVAVYVLIARFANKDFDRQLREHITALRRRKP